MLRRNYWRNGQFQVCVKLFFANVVKCEVIDNNICETINGAILESRSKPINSMLEDIRQYAMTKIAIKREYAKKWKGVIVGPV